MPDEPASPGSTLLERLDVALAEWIAERVSEDIDPGMELQGWEVRGWRWAPDESARQCWIAGLLGVRGYVVRPADVADVLAGRSGRFTPENQEHALIRGARTLLTGLEAHVADDRPPDGWWLVASFRTLTRELRRFRNNAVRRDVPWDALRGVRYPEPGQLDGLLDGFHTASAFGDDPAAFAALHPVRQAGRLVWRFARIAPFPDMNLTMALVAAGAWLMHAGYPPPILTGADRARLQRFVQSRAPHRVPMFAERVYEAIPHGRAARAS